MVRKLHSLPGLIFAVMLSITAATGAILAFDAAFEDISAPGAAETVSIADLAERVTARLPDVEKIARTPSGRVRVLYAEDGAPKTVFVDPVTAEPVGADNSSAAMRTITNLHRAWLAGDAGRAAVGTSALVMLVLAFSGLVLVQRQLGGWRRLFSRAGGSGMRRWHLELGRIAAAGLLVSSITGVYLSLTGFELVPDGSAQHDTLIAASEGPRRPIQQLQGLAGLNLADLREIVLPYPGDGTDPITVKTERFLRTIDPATGEILREEPHDRAWQVHDLMYQLHTARGMAWLALLLGLSACGGAILSLTGAATWLRKRVGRGGITGNAGPEAADILVSVGSEGGTTWGFALTLQKALIASGRKVHIAAMNDLPAATPRARHLIVLTATAGNGEAPANASHFLTRLAAWNPPQGMQATVLGFGDRQFAAFCGFALKVGQALRAAGVPVGVPPAQIDRQSSEAFRAWGNQLSDLLGLPLALDHQPAASPTHRYTLVEREDYGHDVQAPTAILRFRLEETWTILPRPVRQVLNRMPRFSAGDCVAICPPGDHHPRYYSLVSSHRSGILEICVRKQPGGACSGYLHSLAPGDTVEAAIRPNPAFRPNASSKPLILIGAGAGIGPLVGFMREVGHRRAVHLYWGGRNPASDFLYQHEMELHALDGRLAKLRTIFSRLPGGGYVQALVAEDAAKLRALILSGAQVLVCGGRDMASGVATALTEALAPAGLTLAHLRAEGRLVEDVY